MAFQLALSCGTPGAGGLRLVVVYRWDNEVSPGLILRGERAVYLWLVDWSVWYVHCIHMATITAKVFQSGKSQAIRLPKAWRFTTATVQIQKIGHGLLILDPKAESKRVRALAKLYGSCPEFPAVEPLPLREP